MKIAFNDLMEYVKCPIIYLMKTVYGKDEPSMKDQFNKGIKKVLNNFFFRIMDNEILTAEDLKNRWEIAWFKNMEVKDVLYGEQDKKAKMGYQGLDMLINFHRLNYNNPGRPLAVAYDYEIPIGEHILTGTIDLVREAKEGYRKFVDIVYFSTSDYAPDEWETANNLSTTLQSYAFRKEFILKEQRLTYYPLKTNKPIFTTRDEDSFKKLVSFVNIICTSIESNFYYPRPTVLCRQCPYKKFCEHWGLNN
jgi:CRISPR/Cas system-associated exonuclease Cas4 (RecB family)